MAENQVASRMCAYPCWYAHMASVLLRPSGGSSSMIWTWDWSGVGMWSAGLSACSLGGLSLHAKATSRVATMVTIWPASCHGLRFGRRI